MSDNLQARGPQDRSRINVNEKWELAYWTRTLGVTEQQLIEAVKAAGTSVQSVRERLAGPGAA